MSGQLRVDRFADFVTILVCAAGVATVGISWGTHRLDERTSEYHALLLTAVAGMSLLAASNSLLVLFVALELFSISLYVLCALDVWSEASLESGLKYLVIGSVGSAFLLFGSGLVYASTQALRFDRIAASIQANDLGGQAILLLGIAMILGGLAFKASAAPFHQWTPDVYEGAPTSVTAFMATATKVVALCVLMRILTTAFGPAGGVWEGAVAAIAIASMAIGNIAALVQTNVKRMLAYSSIGHAGYLLIPVAAHTPLAGRALVYYLTVYVAMTMAAFAVLAIRERELERPVDLSDLAGLGFSRPFLGGVFAFSLLSLASFPPTGGFLAKLYLFSSAVDAGKSYLAVIGVLATVVSLGYYLRFTLALYTAPAGATRPRALRARNHLRDRHRRDRHRRRDLARRRTRRRCSTGRATRLRRSPMTFSIVACDIRAEAWGVAVAVALARDRRGRTVDRGGCRGRRDAGAHERRATARTAWP